MPPKRPLEENPPSASASDEESEEEEEEGSEEEQEAPKPIQSSTKSIPPKPPSSSDDEDDDDDEDEDEEDVEEQKAKPTADHDNQEEEEDDDDDDSESGSGSGSESDNEPVKHMIAPRTAEVKPISSKPMSDIPKSKKPTSTNTALAKPKRPSEEENDKKRKKKKVADIEDGGDEEIQKKGAAGEEKKLFQRVWTNEDEIILLNSLKDFKREGHNAANDMAGFHAFVKDSLHIDVTKAQLANKIQRLEKKFKNNASRSKEPGKDPVISKPHEWKSYQLSKEIWGDQSGKDNGAETNNARVEMAVTETKRKRTQVKNNGVASPKGKVAKPVKSPKVEDMEEDNKEDNAKEEDGAGGIAEYPYLNQYMHILNHPVLPVPPQGLVGLFGKKGWDLIGTSKAKAFDQKWKAVLIAETKAYLERLDVVRDQTKLMLEVLESSDV